MRGALLLASLGALTACGGSDGPADGGPERARERFEATLTYVRTSFEGQGGSLESAFLSDGTDASGRTGQFVCGIARDRAGMRRGFVSPAFEEGAGTRELLTSPARTRMQKPFWTNGCAAPVRDPAGEEIRFGESPTTTAPAAGNAPPPPGSPPQDSTSGRRRHPDLPGNMPATGPLEVPENPADAPARQEGPDQ